MTATKIGSSPCYIHLWQYHIISAFFCNARVTVAVGSRVRTLVQTAHSYIPCKLITIFAAFESFVRSDVRVAHASFSQFLVCLAIHVCMLRMHAVCLGVERLHKFWRFYCLPRSSQYIPVLLPWLALTLACQLHLIAVPAVLIVSKHVWSLDWDLWFIDEHELNRHSLVLDGVWPLFCFDRTYSSTVLNDRCVQQLYTVMHTYYRALQDSNVWIYLISVFKLFTYVWYTFNFYELSRFEQKLVAPVRWAHFFAWQHAGLFQQLFQHKSWNGRLRNSLWGTCLNGGWADPAFFQFLSSCLKLL
jgi:hypothetical protein